MKVIYFGVYVFVFGCYFILYVILVVLVGLFRYVIIFGVGFWVIVYRVFIIVYFICSKYDDILIISFGIFLK